MFIQVSSYQFRSAHKKTLVDFPKTRSQITSFKVIKNQKLEGFSTIYDLVGKKKCGTLPQCSLDNPLEQCCGKKHLVMSWEEIENKRNWTFLTSETTRGQLCVATLIQVLSVDDTFPHVTSDRPRGNGLKLHQ